MVDYEWLSQRCWADVRVEMTEYGYLKRTCWRFVGSYIEKAYKLLFDLHHMNDEFTLHSTVFFKKD